MCANCVTVFTDAVFNSSGEVGGESRKSIFMLSLLRKLAVR